MNGLIPASDSFGWPTLNIRPEKIVAITAFLKNQGVLYRLGAKAVPIDIDLSEIKDLDCSGFFDVAVYHSTAETGEPLTLVDGSSNLFDFFTSHGFKKSDYDSAATGKDDVLRVGILLASDTPEGIGHIVFGWQGWTCECHGPHGQVGVGRREIASLGFAQHMHWFVLATA